jgi:hypothetical protein
VTRLTTATYPVTDTLGGTGLADHLEPTGGPDYARDVAFQKIRNRVEGTRAAAEKLGI